MQTEEPRSQSLVDLGTDLFLLGLQISSGNVELPDCGSLKQRVLQLIESIKASAQQAGKRPVDVEEANFALVAFLDEMIQHSTWPGKQQWASSPLQATLFSESRAGTRFFERLERLRRESNMEVIEVYYCCLTLGFMGEFRLGGGERLDKLIKDLRRELTRGLSKSLSIHGTRPDEARGGSRSLPLLPIAGASLLLAFGIALLLYLLLSSAQGDAADQLQQITRSLGQ